MAINTNIQKQTLKNRTPEETKNFMEKAYNQAEKELEKYLKKMNKTDKQIRELMETANFAYQIEKTSKDYESAERFLVIAVLAMLNNEDEWLENLIDNFFDEMFEEIVEYFGYFVDNEEKQKILNRKYEDKTYKQRIKINMAKINNRTKKRLQIAYNKKNLYNIGLWLTPRQKMSRKRARGILISELSRIANDIFIYCNKNKKFMYCSVLEERTCGDCESMHGVVLSAEEARDLIPQHNFCKCYFIVLNE